MSSYTLKGTRVLVLGASGVLGGEIAKLLHEEGAHLALSGRDPAKLAELASALGQCPTISADLTSPQACERVVKDTVERLGGLDGIVIAAGVVAFGPLESVSDETLDQLVAVNFTGPLRVIRTALPHLNNGFVVTMSGVVAESPVGGLTAYSAAKSALSASAVALTRETRRRGIRFLDARPPHTETGLASRPIEGEAPRMPEGLDPSIVAKQIVSAIASDTREISASEFA